MGIYSIWYHMDDTKEIHVCHTKAAHDRLRGMSAAGKLELYTFEFDPSAEWLEGFGIQPEDLEIPDSHVIESKSEQKYLHQILRDKIRATLK